MPKRPRETFPCPHCGDDVPAGAKVCPHCGADDETGWAEDSEYTALDLPRGYRDVDREDSADDDDYRAVTGETRSTLPLWVKVTLIVTVVVFVVLALIGR